MYRAPLIACLIVTTLTGCAVAPDNQTVLTETCTQLFEGDDQITKVIVEEANTDVPTFCTCYAKTIAADEANATLHKDALGAINAKRAAAGLGVEDAVDSLNDDIDAGTLTLFTRAELDGTGDDVQDIAAMMAENGGTCSPPT